MNRVVADTFRIASSIRAGAPPVKLVGLSTMSFPRTEQKQMLSGRRNP